MGSLPVWAFALAESAVKEVKDVKMSVLLADYKVLEQDLCELVTLPGRQAELTDMWKALDGNRSGAVSLHKLSGFLRRRYPLLEQKRAVREAYNLTCDQGHAGHGEAKVNEDELPLLLRNLVFFNKVLFVFKEMGTCSKAGKRLSKDDFVRGMVRLGLLEAANAAQQFVIADTDASGTMLFDEFVHWVSDFGIQCLIPVIPVSESRVAVLDALDRCDEQFDQFPSNEDGVSINDLVATLAHQGILESNAMEVFDEFDSNSDGRVTKAEWKEGMKKYRLRLTGLQLSLIKMVHAICGVIQRVSEANGTSIDDFKISTLHEDIVGRLDTITKHSAWSAWAQQHDTDSKTGELRTLDMLVDIEADSLALAANADDQDSSEDKKSVAASLKRLRRHVIEHILKETEGVREQKVAALVQDYTTLEDEIHDMLSNVQRTSEVQKLWASLDANSNGKCSLFEVNRFVHARYPILDYRKAVRMAHAASSLQGEECGREAFPLLLRNLVYFSKVFFVFDKMSQTRMVQKDDFIKGVSDLHIYDADIAALEFTKADKDGSGSISFDEFTEWVNTIGLKSLEPVIPLAPPVGAEGMSGVVVVE